MMLQPRREKIRRLSPWGGSAVSRGAGRARTVFRVRNENKSHRQRRLPVGKTRAASALWFGGEFVVALRDIAVALKHWAQNEQMMGSNYPQRPGFDAGMIRTFFGIAGIPLVTKVLQDRRISYIGVNDITNDIIVYTKKKLSSRDAKALGNATAQIAGQQISILFKHGGVAHAGGPPGPPAVPATYMHQNRFACGSSVYIGSEKGAGTLGCLVRSQDDTLYGLSNNHVTGGSNYAVPGLPIIAPGMLDVAAHGQDPETIGHHHNAYPFIDGIPAIVDANSNLDAALFKISAPDRISSSQRGAYDTPDQCIPMQVGMRVSKAGRTTGVTHGEVVSELPDCEGVEYEVDICGGKKYVYFKSLFVIQATNGLFSQAGDSGSLVINLDANGVRRATGIIVAGDETGLSFALSLDRVLDHFDVTLVSGHNV